MGCFCCSKCYGYGTLNGLFSKGKHNSRLILDPGYPDIDMPEFNKGRDWSDVYGEVEETIPYNAPKSRGKGVDLSMFMDSDHAENKANKVLWDPQWVVFQKQVMQKGSSSCSGKGLYRPGVNMG